MKIGIIIMFFVTLIELIALLFGKSVLAGKVYIDPSPFSIVMMIIVLVILGYLAIKLKWELNYVKCPKCKDTFNYKDTINGKCPHCKDVDTMDIKEYYEKFPDEKEE